MILLLSLIQKLGFAFAFSPASSKKTVDFYVRSDVSMRGRNSRTMTSSSWSVNFVRRVVLGLCDAFVVGGSGINKEKIGI